MAEKFGILQTMLHGFDYSGFLTIGHKALTGAVNHVLGAKDGKKGFADTALALSEAKAVRKEVAALAARHGCAQDLLLGRSASMACGLLCLVLLTGLEQSGTLSFLSVLFGKPARKLGTRVS